MVGPITISFGRCFHYIVFHEDLESNQHQQQYFAEPKSHDFLKRTPKEHNIEE
jgi:hypothetical protein